MALRTVIRPALISNVQRKCFSISGDTQLLGRSVNNTKIIYTRNIYNENHGDKRGENPKQRHGSYYTLMLGTAAGLMYVAFKNTFQDKRLLAEEVDVEAEIIEKENRIRQFSRIETIFDYFATYKCLNQTASFNKNEILMSVADFYNAVTPWSTVTHGSGRGEYKTVGLNDISSKEIYEAEKLPRVRPGRTSLLNQVQKEGMLTFHDYCFLVNILATPRRYMDIVFHCFDVSADKQVNAKEFCHVIANVTSYKGNPEDLMSASHSGLMNYLFGKDRAKELNIDDFKHFQKELMDDIIWLEFTRYSADGETMTDQDFCDYILLSSNITKRKRKQMIKRVNSKVDKRKDGVTFEAFKAFYYVLAGGSDLERALFFINEKKEGIDSGEFTFIARWVADADVDQHIVELIYFLLDDDEDEHLSIKEFSPVLFQWRNSRGFHHQSLQFILGALKL